MIEEGIHQEIKNDTEIPVVCLEYNYNWSIGCLVLRYSFGIINWRLEEITKIDRKIKKLLIMYKT